MADTTGTLGEDKEYILNDLLDARNILGGVVKHFVHLAMHIESKDEANGLAAIAGGLAVLTDGINLIGEEIESNGHL